MGTISAIYEATHILANCNVSSSKLTAVINNLSVKMQGFEVGTVEFQRLSAVRTAILALHRIQYNLDLDAMVESGNATDTQASNGRLI